MEQQMSLYGTGVAVSQSVTITEKVEVTPAYPLSYKLKADHEWGWEELRDYVVDMVEQRFGLFPRDLPKEVSIMKSFTERFGRDAPRIARAAYEVYQGYWGGAPIRLSRFARASDEWFARVILAQLPQEQSLF
jgi:hypothetical protein